MLPNSKTNIDPAFKKRISDIQKLFYDVFSTEKGQLVIDHLEKYSHVNFPNYDNVYATYSKVGEQTLVAYIKALVAIAKNKGG
jgi:transcriptional regulator NrdR family protein